jgi:hypothetical protein
MVRGIADVEFEGALEELEEQQLGTIVRAKISRLSLQ